MANKHLSLILRHLRRTVSFSVSGESTDGQLLERFAAQHDEQAFETLVHRHGPLVLAVCRRMLSHADDAADVFQATFLVLARQARSIQRQESVGRWLYEVAYRLSLKAKTSALRRRTRESQAAGPTATEPLSDKGAVGDLSDLDWRELRLVLDEELHRLPEKHRGPLVLCYLEGKTNEEAARELGCPAGSMSWRLGQARDLLRTQLARRGVVLSTGLLVPVLADKAAAAVPATLIATTLQGAVQFAGKSTAAGVAASVTALAEGMLRDMFVRKVKITVALLLTLAVVAVGSIAIIQRNWSTSAPASNDPLANAADVAGETPVSRLSLWMPDGLTPAMNKAGDGYPTFLDARQGPRKEGGIFAVSLDHSDTLNGPYLRMSLSEGKFHAQFNPYSKDGKRGFAREYVAEPEKWRFNTYNRMRLWIKLPEGATLREDRPNFSVAAHVKRVQAANFGSDEDGGGLYHHFFSVPLAGQWTQLIVNMHPTHGRIDRNNDPGNLPHPTGEPDCNYFDAMTRFVIADTLEHGSYPAAYFLKSIEFYWEPFPESDAQIMSLAGTCNPTDNRLIVTWSRPRGSPDIVHEIRYAFRNIHEIGWSAAQPAPGGTIVMAANDPRSQPLIYDTTELPLTWRSVVFLAIKPRDSDLFTQIAVPLVQIRK
jgi:RNA polymerase sigma factor (sigma-70 family)